MGPSQHNSGNESLKSEKPLTREQRRFKERVEKEASAQLRNFVNKFYSFFLDNDPDGFDVKAKQKEYSAKWKMYCHSKGLSEVALSLFDDACTKIFEKYHEQLKEA